MHFISEEELQFVWVRRMYFGRTRRMVFGGGPKTVVVWLGKGIALALI